MERIEYKLLGAECSMYTGKVRSYMKWNGIPFKEVIASDSVYKTILIPLTTVSFMPTLLIVHHPRDGSPPHWETIQDSKAIIDYFENAFPPSNPDISTPFNHPVLPKTPRRAFAAMMLELLADEWTAMQGMFWRWGDGEWEKARFEQQMDFLDFEFGNNYTGGQRGKSVAEIKEIGRNISTFFRTAGPSLLGITPTTSPTFRSNFTTLLALLSTHFESHPFILGSTISLADCAFYGPFYAHLCRDPIPSSLIKTTAPLVYEWVERVSGLGRFAGKNVERWDDESGTFVVDYGGHGGHERDDFVPSTVTAVAKLLLLDYLPILTSTITNTLTHLTSLPPTKPPIPLPRFLPHHPFTITASTDPNAETAHGSAALRTHAVWMLQRIIDRVYGSEGQRVAAESWMEEVGGQELLGLWRGCVGEWVGSGWRVGRRENEIIALWERGEESER